MTGVRIRGGRAHRAPDRPTGPRSWLRRWAAAVLTGAVLLVTGCSGQPEPGGGDTPPPVSPLADCTALSAPPPQAASPPPGQPGESLTGADPGQALPELSLTCLTGGEPFPLADLRGPAVVNLWATWCPPCRKELPVLQRYADQASGEVHVVGVAVRSAPDAAVALADDLRLRFPSLNDYDEKLSAELGLFNLPVTLLVDQAGQVRHVHQWPPFSHEHELAELVEQHLGVAVGSDGN